ncbi:hypothetical protein [Oricola nitratireducens]|uniref:hypothetical protein n=1 Tax=Oricola nitratireducens TaxID=2775868 RepID=UPI0018683020|nr:hypothetical protein [Oricola nitratireducens]
MNAIASIFDGYGMRPGAGAQSIAAAGETGIEEMFLALEDEALRTKVALRVQTEGAGRQPLSRVDVTDLALMIVTGGAMSRAFAAAAAGQPPVSTLPGGYGQAW